ncbi:sigma-70 family RNA polymerase sigma factor [Streptococcus acidominimus]|uniref:Sigma-70 family RNA polymerase sigma factor n=1 Tax=Streptococcus acidominimus TaxID=1326 RepID=A0A4Y9FN90_STRAI|nr:sigma-70 family RNA polymerase sigma factor [Streptococcus acidominimus]MBF0818924.1 sigma-70 family RNA polymerase sigma factor [Streptococcus acidominimus]MBF0838178.1 sigma-70 family RNA polymerase sigma factor [Streptococcus acidominimus]MBF0846201.1 sigma-70 family RNA polymerase sigma factor [Streptococcus danieliae]TFU30641.1 sigma-70 family RNA polymerase sigma factor [Streptococcus acidominimus]
MEFKDVYAKVRPIVQKTRREYYVKLWEPEDWDQEGMYILYRLLQQEAGIVGDELRLLRYFKVKFRNYVNDMLRKQSTQKRGFDRLRYEEIGEISHMISSGGLVTDELVCLRDSLARYRSQLSSDDSKNYDRLVSGDRFKGRKKMLRSLHQHLISEDEVK